MTPYLHELERTQIMMIGIRTVYAAMSFNGMRSATRMHPSLRACAHGGGTADASWVTSWLVETWGVGIVHGAYTGSFPCLLTGNGELLQKPKKVSADSCCPYNY